MGMDDMAVDALKVTTATPGRADAEALARRAVEARLAASAQVIGPVGSFFWHSGEFGTGEEWQLSLVTSKALYPALERLLLDEHPWQTPELCAVEIVEASPGYAEWLRKTLDDGGR